MFHEHLKEAVYPVPVEKYQIDEDLQLRRKTVELSQSGVNFRSICDTCNNTLLGIHYDPELIKLSRELGLFVRTKYRSGIALPEQISLLVKTNRVARAVVGHLLAAVPWLASDKPFLVENQFHESMREYFLDPNKQLPEDLEIYYWLYPSNTYVIVRGLTVGRIDNGKYYVHGDLLKFLPVAFWVVYKHMSTGIVGAQKLIKNREGGIDNSEYLDISFRRIPSIYWPERPTEEFWTFMPPELSFFSEERNTSNS